MRQSSMVTCVYCEEEIAGNHDEIFRILEYEYNRHFAEPEEAQ